MKERNILFNGKFPSIIKCEDKEECVDFVKALQKKLHLQN